MTMLRNPMLGAVTSMMMISVSAICQAPATPATGPASEVQRSYAGVKANILKSADRMSAADYAFKPTPDVRTFARVVDHIIEAQLHTCGAVNHAQAAKAPAQTADKTADKTAIVEALKASFAECDKAYAALTDANTTETFDAFGTKRSRLGLMWGNVAHDSEQYATLALYLRLKGLAPPSSEK